MTELAILGGTPVRTRKFPAYRLMGEAEQDAVREVLESNVLSRFLGCWHEDFLGGPQVRAFEAEWAEAYDSRFAVSVNSATSGLYAAIGAAGIGPGDEVIVPPLTMCASATAALIYNGVPVFADVDAETFCIDPAEIERKITPRTKAIVVVDLYGHPADMDAIMALAEKHGLIVIQDSAQSPFASYDGRKVGTLAHMTVFSLNYHKHIHTGEGGVVTTDDERFAERLQMIRNHAEAVVDGKGTADLVNMIGFNFRLGEIEAAIGRQQLRSGGRRVEERRANVAYLEERFQGLPAVRPAIVKAGCTHSYYVHAMHYDPDAFDVPVATVIKALQAELPLTELRETEGTLVRGGPRPLYLMPMYQKQVGYGTKSCPFRCPHYEGEVDYAPGLCPNAEHLTRTLLTHELMRPPMTPADLDDVAAAFSKVLGNLEKLRGIEPR